MKLINTSISNADLQPQLITIRRDFGLLRQRQTKAHSTSVQTESLSLNDKFTKPGHLQEL